MNRRFLGFTLSELLVALGIIGLIASFTVPKIMLATTEQQSKLELKEALNAIESLAMQGYADEKIIQNNIASFVDYIFDHIKNVKQICRTSVRNEGCAKADSVLHWGNGVATPGIALNNGGLIVFFSASGVANYGANIVRTGLSTDTVNTCFYLMAYDSQQTTEGSSGATIRPYVHLPIVIREGNAGGGLGTIFKKDYIYNIQATWLYQ
jgi:prepilin-type N-terminal cleavage/methylation domain-containing protein